VPDGVFAFLREEGGDRVLVLVSFSDEPVSVPLGDERAAAVLLSTRPDAALHAPDSFTLRPREGVVLELAR
jgi:hypothetical protein